MADHPSDEWEGGNPRILKRRAIGTRKAGEPEEAEAVTGFDRPPLAGGEKYAPNVPNGHRLTPDPDKKKSKAVSSKSAENKAVGAASKK